MASKPKLNPEILVYLHKRLGKPISTIRKDISLLRRDYPMSTSNGVAQIYAQQHGESVRRLLGREDKLSIPAVTFAQRPVVIGKKKSKSDPKIKVIIQFETTDVFLKKHLDEINRAYTRNCYTCVFVLTRKVIENLIIKILRAKFPKDIELYFDTKKVRNLDFSIVLENLYKKRNEFNSDGREAIERLNQKLKPFKNDANDKAHSLYHIVENSKEVEDWNLDTIMALIAKIMQGIPKEADHDT